MERRHSFQRPRDVIGLRAYAAGCVQLEVGHGGDVGLAVLYDDVGGAICKGLDQSGSIYEIRSAASERLESRWGVGRFRKLRPDVLLHLSCLRPRSP